jgi:hypothetical protein
MMMMMMIKRDYRDEKWKCKRKIKSGRIFIVNNDDNTHEIFFILSIQYFLNQSNQSIIIRKAGGGSL